MLVGIIIGITNQYRLCAIFTHRLHLDVRCGLGHHNGRLNPHLTRREGDPLGVVSGRGGDHATRQLLLTEARHFVVGPAQLEGEDWL